MSSIQDLRFHIRSIRNIGQVTGALETVSTSKVRRSVEAYKSAMPYAEKAWKVVVHLARQPGHEKLHPLLEERSEIKKVMVVMVSGDKGLAGAYNVNVVRSTLEKFDKFDVPVSYVPVGRKGRDMLIRKNKHILAEFSDLPTPPAFVDVSSIGYLIVSEYLLGEYDQVYLSFTRFENMSHQKIIIRKLLPLDVQYYGDSVVNELFDTTHKSNAVFEYEPDSNLILDQVISRFTSWQVYAAILSSHASEHASRRMAMHYAKVNANELLKDLSVEYNKIRQQTITDDIIDIAGAAESLI